MAGATVPAAIAAATANTRVHQPLDTSQRYFPPRSQEAAAAIRQAIQPNVNAVSSAARTAA